MSKNDQISGSITELGDFSEKDAETIVRRCCNEQQRTLSRLQTVAKSNRRKAKRLSRRYLASKSVRIARAYDAWRRIKKPKSSQPIPYGDILKAGLSLDMWNASEEPVFLRPKERLNGGTRYLPIVEVREKARDQIAYDVAKVLAELHPNQFMTRGTAALNAWLEEHLPDGALVLTTDIPSCHDTIKRSSVMRDVPLPGHVLKAVLIDTKDRAVHLVKEPKGLASGYAPSSVENFSSFVDAGPSCRGILTGAALALYASELVIKNILAAAENAAAGVHAAAWSDNLIIILDQASDAPSVTAAVQNAVAHNFGMDVLDGLARRWRETKLPGEFLYCGQWYTMAKGKLKRRVEPSRVGAAILKVGLMMGHAKTASDWKRIKQTIIGYAISVRHDPKGMKEYLDELMSYGEKEVNQIIEALNKAEKIE